MIGNTRSAGMLVVEVVLPQLLGRIGLGAVPSLASHAAAVPGARRTARSLLQARSTGDVADQRAAQRGDERG